MGLPRDWNVVKRWIYPNEIPSLTPGKEIPLGNIKNKEIPLLNDYENNPSADFWEKFPKNKLPNKPSTGINVDELEKEYFLVKNMMTESQKERAEKSILNLREGGSSYQKLPELPGCFCKNANSTFLYGQTITDNIASWVKSGFAAGPFDQPPTNYFRVNSILATKQNEKVRTILHKCVSSKRRISERQCQRI